jgi:hypothetical protein
MMTLTGIEERVRAIRERRRDPEEAHSLEGGLYADFIAFVASGEDGPIREMAQAILKTQEIEFPRWCA